MKLSELTPSDAARHAFVEADYPLLGEYLDAARSYVLGYTGLGAAEADNKPELAVAALVLTADLVKNKEATVEDDKANRLLAAFLGMHAVNLL